MVPFVGLIIGSQIVTIWVVTEKANVFTLFQEKIPLLTFYPNAAFKSDQMTGAIRINFHPKLGWLNNLRQE